MNLVIKVKGMHPQTGALQELQFTYPSRGWYEGDLEECICDARKKSGLQYTKVALQYDTYECDDECDNYSDWYVVVIILAILGLAGFGLAALIQMVIS